jgi:mono/diheme cytochrome c family protein
MTNPHAPERRRTRRAAAAPRWRPGPAALLATGAVLVVALSLRHGAPDATTGAATPVTAAAQDRARAAFLEAYAVLMHPRCVNCHPAGDRPLQGDDSRVHAQNVQRGADGKGLFALKCANCHQPANVPGENMPPGTRNWHLPPADMPMVFQGLTPAELAAQLKDRRRNGGKTLPQILHHVAKDPLVLWGWDPGDGRSKPPLTHEQFVERMREWIDGGAPIPEE